MSALPGVIRIDGLQIECIIGILPQERLHPQRLELDAELQADFAAAAASDAVAHTVNYAEVGERLAALAVDGRFELVETLAARACELVLADYPAVDAVTVTLRKPDAVPAARSVGVTLEKRR